MGYSNCEFNNLRGFWQSPNEFNAEAGIKLFTMYIGEYRNGSYPVYILMVDDDEKILINSPTTMCLNQTITNKCSLKKHKEFNCKFADLDSEFMPNDIILQYYPRSGKLIFSGIGDDTIYGCLFKNPMLTEMDLIKDEIKKESTPTIDTCDYEDQADVG